MQAASTEQSAGRAARLRVALALGAAALALAIPTSVEAKAGDVYVSTLGEGSGKILRIGPGGGKATPVASGIDATGLVLAPSGKLLAADRVRAGVASVNLRTGAISTFVNGAPFSTPQDVAIAADGSILVSDRKAGPGETPALLRVDPRTKHVDIVASGPPFDVTLRGLAPERDGTVLAAGIDSVFRISPGGVVSTLVPSDPSFSGADGVALTPDERTLFVAVFDSTPNRIARVDTATGATSTYAPQNDSVDLALRPDGSLLNTDEDASVVRRVAPGGSPTTSFSADPALAVGELSAVLVEPARCGGKVPTVVGTTGPDTLTGSPYADVISTVGGRDFVRGLGGADTICGGNGKDRLVGGAGRDRLIGGKGRDRLRGGKGHDTCVDGRPARSSRC